jgi:ribosome biogenesis GTPase A
MRVRYSFSSRRTGHTENILKQKEKIPDMIKKIVRTSDIILEVLDARFIDETRNAEIEELIKKQGKKLIYVLNKSDLLDKDKIKQIKRKLEIENLMPYVFVSSTMRRGRKDLRDRIKIEVKRLEEGYERKQVGVIGYPNTGKSSLINYLTGRGSAPTSARAGFTKGLQKIKLAENLLLLDSPGIIPEKEYSHRELGKITGHAIIGARGYSEVKDPEFIVNSIMKQYPGVLEKYYSIKAEDFDDFIEKVGRNKNFLLKGGIVDADRTARFILREWQEGKIKV